MAEWPAAERKAVAPETVCNRVALAPITLRMR